MMQSNQDEVNQGINILLFISGGVQMVVTLRGLEKTVSVSMRLL